MRIIACAKKKYECARNCSGLFVHACLSRQRSKRRKGSKKMNGDEKRKDVQHRGRNRGLSKTEEKIDKK